MTTVHRPYEILQVADMADGGLALRMDERAQRIVVEPGRNDGFAYFGIEIRDAPTVADEGRLEPINVVHSPAFNLGSV